jgi:hypothetical protein
LHAGNSATDNFDCQDGKSCPEEFSFQGRPSKPHTRHRREAEQIRKPDRTAARGAPRLRASRYEKLTVGYLATIRIAAINEWLPRHL